MPFVNCYENATRAAAYSKLEFANTYHLAFRDLPAVFQKHVTGKAALDFGCGAGRSTRFLQQLGFEVVGVDISPHMLSRAREIDQDGDYRLIPDDDLTELPQRSFSLILSAFTFDNIPGSETKIRLFHDLRALLQADGAIVNVVSSPDIYLHEWASFSTKAFPENGNAKPGDPVKIVTTELEDATPAVDILWPAESYRDVYARADLRVADVLKPLATGDEPFPWINETRIAPWVIYVLKPFITGAL
jgi:SAM-dependent methyltransferase